MNRAHCPKTQLTMAPDQTASVGQIFPGNGEMARRMGAFDWAETGLGPVEQWPPN